MRLEWWGFSLREVGMAQRLKVFIDYQNTYMRAREVFSTEDSRYDFTFGQIYPRRLATIFHRAA